MKQIDCNTKKRKYTHIKEKDRYKIEGLLQGKKSAREIAGHYDIEVREIEVMSDHIHMLASAPPRISPSQIVQIVKSTSTKHLFEKYPWVRRQYWGGEIWIGGYFVRSVGSGLTKEAIARYIKAQSEER